MPITGDLGNAGETDVTNTGTLVGAFNIGAVGVSPTTVNGVTFAPFEVLGQGSGTTVGNFTLFTYNSGTGLNILVTQMRVKAT